VIWLLKGLLMLYPPRWRRRYGAEVAELIAARPFSIVAALDLVAGAIDAWLNPQLAAAGTPGTPDAKGDVSMIAKMMQLKCTGHGPQITAGDTGRATAIMLGGTLVLTLLWVWSVARFGKNDYVTALSPMAYFLPTLLSLRYTSLKGRSAAVQTIFIGGFSVLLSAFFLLVAWINT
jgi:hypothetical protein